MDAFNSYHNEYLAIQQSINTKLDSELPKLRGGEFPHLTSHLPFHLTHQVLVRAM